MKKIMNSTLKSASNKTIFINYFDGLIPLIIFKFAESQCYKTGPLTRFCNWLFSAITASSLALFSANSFRNIFAWRPFISYISTLGGREVRKWQFVLIFSTKIILGSVKRQGIRYNFKNSLT